MKEYNPHSYILSINAGSSSVKITASPLLKKSYPDEVNIICKIDLINSPHKCQIIKNTTAFEIDVNRDSPIHYIKDYLEKSEKIKIIAIGHRVVHGGRDLVELTKINESVIKKIKNLISLAPLHQIHAIEHIEYMVDAKIPQYAYFDTGFHKTIHSTKRRYAIPNRFYQSGIMKYGFHGIAYESVLDNILKIIPDKIDGRIIAIHLGNGASICAINKRQSVNTTMGLTPLDGLVMGTRCGRIDPSAVLIMQINNNIDPEEMHRILSKESGLLGLSEISSDLRDIVQFANNGNKKALEAIDIFIQYITREMFGMISDLGGVDLIVFSGGIGENCYLIRERVISHLKILGITVDSDLNKRSSTIISSSASSTPVIIVKINEEIVIINKIRTLLYNSNT